MRVHMGKVQVEKGLKDLFYIAVACVLSGIAFNVFMRQNEIIGGGVTGLSQMLNYLTDVPVSVLGIAMNIPLYLLGLLWLERSSIIMTIITATTLSMSYDFFSFLPAFTGDRLFAAIIAGVIMGVSGGILFSRGITSGGSDLLGQLIRTKTKGVSIANLTLVINAIVITLATIVYGEAETALYSIATLYAASTMIDRILVSKDNARMAMIISDKGEELAEAITQNMVRGVTVIDAVGAYSKAPRNVLMCVVRRSELIKLRTFVQSIDKDSFIVFVEVSEAWGKGFKLKDVI